MQISDLRPADFYAQSSGVKAVIYGGPGAGKTPIAKTCPNPILLATEKGMLSMKGSNLPTYEALTAKELDDFFLWLFTSNEVKKFDTVCIDSSSHCAEIYLEDAKKHTKHGLQQYGEMAERTYAQFKKLNELKEKHAYIIAKEDLYTVNNVQMKRPFYPGKELPRETAHLFDCILHLAKVNIQGLIGEQLAFRCNGSYDIMARNRLGVLNEFEFPDFTSIVKKCGY